MGVGLANTIAMMKMCPAQVWLTPPFAIPVPTPSVTTGMMGFSGTVNHMMINMPVQNGNNVTPGMPAAPGPGAASGTIAAPCKNLVVSTKYIVNGGGQNTTPNNTLMNLTNGMGIDSQTGPSNMVLA